jgi:hypothetical protein
MRWLLAAVLAGIFAFSGSEARSWNEGRVLDAETKEPVSGVVIYMEWSEKDGKGGLLMEALEVLTDQQGYFVLDRFRSGDPWTRSSWSQFILFKSGYQPIIGDRNTWKAFSSQGGDPSRADMFTIDQGQLVIMLSKPDLRERRFSTRDLYPSGDVPDEKKQLLLAEIDREREFMNPAHVVPGPEAKMTLRFKGMRGQKVVLEDPETRMEWVVGVGEEANGWKVVSITPLMLTLQKEIDPLRGVVRAARIPIQGSALAPPPPHD